MYLTFKDADLKFVWDSILKKMYQIDSDGAAKEIDADLHMLERFRPMLEKVGESIKAPSELIEANEKRNRDQLDMKGNQS